VAVYGVVLLMNGVAYSILARLLVVHHGHDSLLARSVGRVTKGNISVGAYLAAVLISQAQSWVSLGLYVAVAVMWVVPDRRIEKVLREGNSPADSRS